jgi:hypothetical protein
MRNNVSLRPVLRGDATGPAHTVFMFGGRRSRFYRCRSRSCRKYALSGVIDGFIFCCSVEVGRRITSGGGVYRLYS